MKYFGDKAREGLIYICVYLELEREIADRPRTRAVRAVVPEEELMEESSARASSARKKARWIELSTFFRKSSFASSDCGKSASSKNILIACFFTYSAASEPPWPSNN